MRLTVIFIVIFSLLGNSIVLGYNLPVPRNTIKQGEKKITMYDTLYTMENYQSQLSSEEIISFYKQNLFPQGFILIDENKVTNTIIFNRPKSKDNLAFNIKDMGDLNSLAVTYWKGDLPKPQTFSPNKITKDAPGRDLPGIPRYPGSIRIASAEYEGMKSAAYKTPHKKRDVFSFYERQMSSYGWKRVNQDTLVKQKAAELLGQDMRLAGGDLLLFEKKHNVCTIMVMARSGKAEGCGPAEYGSLGYNQEGCEGCGSEETIVSISILSKRG